MSILTVVLSIILAFLLLGKPLFLLCYFVSLFVMTLLIFKLRIKISYVEEETPSETEQGTYGLKTLLLVLVLLITFLGLPLLLAAVLDPYIWFTFFLSLMTGFSLAEILFYTRSRR